MRVFVLFSILALTSFQSLFSQRIIDSYSVIEDELREINLETSTSGDLVTGKGFNLFIQRKVFTYLSGSSEATLSKFYATYANESDKLTLGFNVPHLNKKTGRLISLWNPMIEANVKENFATLYKKNEWQSDIRFGLKYTYLMPFSTIKYDKESAPYVQRRNMIQKRSKVIEDILARISTESSAALAPATELNRIQTDARRQIRREIARLSALTQTKATTEEIQELTKELNILWNNFPSSIDTTEKYFKEKLMAYEDTIARAEADYLNERGTYNSVKTYWLSFWGFYPVTDRDYYVAMDKSQPFKPVDFANWEINAQGNFMHETDKWSYMITPGYKLFNNNHAMADLMTQVDHYEYLQMPGIDTLHAGILEKGTGYIGAYDKFITHNVNLQFIVMMSSKKGTGKKEKEKFITPGLSLKCEKNFGDYSAMDFRLGFPFILRGKDKAVNIEPQIKWKNINNYADKIDYKVQPTFGINIGLPFVALFK